MSLYNPECPLQEVTASSSRIEGRFPCLPDYRPSLRPILYLTNGYRLGNSGHRIGSASPAITSSRDITVAFFRGSLSTWTRFSSEFAPAGLIDLATAEEKYLAWMPATNDVNEGLLGCYPSYDAGEAYLNAAPVQCIGHQRKRPGHKGKGNTEWHSKIPIIRDISLLLDDPDAKFDPKGSRKWTGHNLDLQLQALRFRKVPLPKVKDLTRVADKRSAGYRFQAVYEKLQELGREWPQSLEENIVESVGIQMVEEARIKTRLK
ncbi:hypothetical protein BT96DRAFT_989762 [Gymnopus androsaceus JB14]|uniref:Uncharacterized protein n=1 Tax=Gymnopus androsaceus JB14 TaxID=1447944 RepID=A0A6A4I5J1_9AGAR|nr:hypothetical protein BT96DRAFT_989762 [Gymnopus androsaceus JB14]